MTDALMYKDFKEQVSSIMEEVGPVGDDGKSGRHSTYLDISEDTADGGWNDYEAVSVEPDYAMGCGCWTGLRIEIRRKDG